MSDLEHGYLAYGRGCRCNTCRAAKAAYMRQQRATRKGLAATAGITHGTTHAYTVYGCRCHWCRQAKATARLRETRYQTTGVNQ